LYFVTLDKGCFLLDKENQLMLAVDGDAVGGSAALQGGATRGL